MTEQNRILTGIPASPGIVIGRARVFSDLVETQPSQRLLYTAEEVSEEIDNFRRAVEQTEEELVRVKEEIAAAVPEQAHILELHLMLLRDRLLSGETERLIKEQNLNAARALYQAFQKVTEIFRRVEDPYIKGRITDVEGVYRRLLGHLTGSAGWRSPLSSSEPMIIVARDLSPADTSQMSPAQVLGFILERGGRTSHTAILAQSLEIPAVVGLDNATRELAGTEQVILDGLTGQIVLDPDDQMLRTYLARKQEYEAFKGEVAQCGFLPAITVDEFPAQVMANIEMPEEVTLALKYGADGVGLYRTEFLYLRQRQLPTEEEQFQDYRRVVEAMHPKTVTIRTLDIGGDKFLTTLQYPPEMNPALGLRAIRFSLKERAIFRTQLKAILRASAYGQVRVMFPLISSIRELRDARELLNSVKEDLLGEGHPFDPHLPVGAMIEVPAAVTLAGLLAQQADFFSIGTNDLIQYALAIDRVNKQVADMYQPLHPAVLRMIRQVVEAGQAAGISVSICGEMAGDPLYVPVLMGLGIAELSMNANAIPMVKRLIRMTTVEESREMARHALELTTVEEINAYMGQEMKRRFPEITRFDPGLAGNHLLS